MKMLEVKPGHWIAAHCGCTDQEGAWSFALDTGASTIRSSYIHNPNDTSCPSCSYFYWTWTKEFQAG